MKKEKQLSTGADVVVKAALDAGAISMYGYPITPTCEILSGWSNVGEKCLQTEDEIAAGFGVCGSVLAGEKSFTASSGPGHILLQDSFSMAEAMRLPFVMIVGQRGGPSSGTVIYSQQEVTLACYGGNGEGMRLVYSPADLDELYLLTRRAFNDAWKYRFPAVVLTDGYTLKTKKNFDSTIGKGIKNIPAIELVPKDKVVHWPNIYTFEEELNYEVMAAKKDFDAVSEEIAEAEVLFCDDAEILLVAHGIVGNAGREAVKSLRKQGLKVGLFRPITLRPFPKKQLDKIFNKCGTKKVLIAESSLGQLAKIVRDELAPEVCTKFYYLQRPGLGIEPDEIVEEFKKI